MRKLIPSGTCVCCGQSGPVWTTHYHVLDLGVPGGLLEPDTRKPDLCDACDLAERCLDPWYRDLMGGYGGPTFADLWQRHHQAPLPPWATGGET